MSVGAVDTLQRGEVFNQHFVRETGGVNEQVGVDAVVALIYVVGRNPCAEGNFSLRPFLKKLSSLQNIGKFRKMINGGVSARKLQ